MRFNDGDKILNRKGRAGRVVGDSGGTYVRVRYDDGSRDAWVQRQNLKREQATNLLEEARTRSVANGRRAAAERKRADKAEATLTKVREYLSKAEVRCDDVAELIDGLDTILDESAFAERLLPVSPEPYSERGGRIPTQGERDQTRRALSRPEERDVDHDR